MLGNKHKNIPALLPRLNGIQYLIAGNHDCLPSTCKPDVLKGMEKLYLSNGMSKYTKRHTSIYKFTNTVR